MFDTNYGIRVFVRIITELPIHAAIMGDTCISHNTKPDYNNRISPKNFILFYFFFSLIPKFVHSYHIRVFIVIYVGK